MLSWIVGSKRGQHRRFQDCGTFDEKVNWLQSDHGQRALHLRPRIKSLYESGELLLLLENSEFSRELEVWLDGYSSSQPTNANFTRIDSDSSHWFNSNSRPQPSHVEIPEETKLKFLVEGYVILEDIVPQQLMKNALRYLNNMLGEGNYPCERKGNWASIPSGDSRIISLYNETELRPFVDAMFYAGNSSMRTHVHGGQIVVKYPDLNDPPRSIGGLHWHIDGIDKGQHSAFNLLVGVALSDQTAFFSGNLLIWPGSHHIIQDSVRRYVSLRNNHDIGIEDVGLFRAGDKNKPDLGEPTQVQLRKGDAVIVHQKVAHQPGPNTNEEIRKMVYFRLSHQNHEGLKNASLDNMWIEFEGMRDVV